jgi:5-methylcytosine-specific restriction endonuclease McrA
MGIYTQLRRRLLDERGYLCERCIRLDYQRKRVAMELHHNDGNRKNNKKENLSLLCKDCHRHEDKVRREMAREFAKWL